MTKEQKYEAELTRLGIYDPAFDPAIHQLAILERDQYRARKAWKASSQESGEPAMADKLYAVILQQDKMILTLRESLGLTPKALRRFKAGFGAEADDETERTRTPLELIMERRRNAG